MLCRPSVSSLQGTTRHVVYQRKAFTPSIHSLYLLRSLTGLNCCPNLWSQPVEELAFRYTHSASRTSLPLVQPSLSLFIPIRQYPPLVTQSHFHSQPSLHLLTVISSFLFMRRFKRTLPASLIPNRHVVTELSPTSSPPPFSDSDYDSSTRILKRHPYPPLIISDPLPARCI